MKSDLLCSAGLARRTVRVHSAPHARRRSAVPNLVSGSTLGSHRDILGLPVCDLGWADTFAFAAAAAERPFGQSIVTFLDADKANRMMRDAGYRAVLERQVVLPDGRGVDLASFLLHGSGFPAKPTAAAFIPALFTYIARPMRIALIGGQPSTLMQATERLRRHAPWHAFLPVSDSAFDPARSDAVLERVRAAEADILLVAMDGPEQERWIDRHVGPGHARLVLSAGNLFATLLDEAPEAPRGVEKLRHEWLYRFLNDPARALRGRGADALLLWHALRRKLSGRTRPRTVGRTAKAGLR